MLIGVSVVFFIVAKRYLGMFKPGPIVPAAQEVEDVYASHEDIGVQLGESASATAGQAGSALNSGSMLASFSRFLPQMGAAASSAQPVESSAAVSGGRESNRSSSSSVHVYNDGNVSVESGPAGARDAGFSAAVADEDVGHYDIGLYDSSGTRPPSADSGSNGSSSASGTGGRGSGIGISVGLGSILGSRNTGYASI